jgi:ABC-type antimicrobial peptide transport system permease subunit
LVRRAVRDLDAGLPIMSAARLDDITATELGLPRLTSALSGGFSLAAVALTATGVYALLSLMTTARTREIGIRVALGATRTSVRWLILRQSVGLATAGLALGIVAWQGLAVLLDRQVPGLFADVTLGYRNVASVETLVAATIVAVTMVVASAVPVRRALGIDPAVALKGDGGTFQGSGG